ncbi:c-type cytochrome biogenesis protein CcmI [Falsiroseomonas selenitidurans]|uniref:C-type cytochrome biogenesis protein CcmI n=1 Tax=Falsiroseomonas selenitidurans TaxID=2716335 RepID=A0ABX1E609_9PROT|nr:c-type cytochrome biogenesis protein CcmI [Falsiroseomonas selenitidurans]NKC32406.1 c-type cytochrome biogenesis protein CcmI [Falsiroseomonas selenitidurans]
MIWLLLGGLAALALAPLAWALLRPARLRGRTEADLAIYRAQLAELDREREAGRLEAAQHEAARLEVQRRILAAPQDADIAGGRGTPALLAALLFLLPAAGLALYLVRGVPDMPSAPHAERQRLAEAEDRMMETLRARVAAMDPATDLARQGLILLGNAERSRGNMAEAAAAWRRALQARFDASLAGDLAEVEIERGETDAAAALIARALGSAPQEPRLRFLAGLAEARAGRADNARRTWQALLAEAPPDAPWRPVVETQLRALP